MAEEKERFLTRWSRLKHDAKAPQGGEKEKQAEAPALPAVETLTPESDFSSFMHPKVEDALRRVALKKLFSDPHFNVPDPFEAYSGDWTGGDPIPDEMLATLNQARTLLFDNKEKKQSDAEEEPRVTSAGDVAGEEKAETKPDEPGSKDA